MNRKLLLLLDDDAPYTSMPATTFVILSPPPTTTTSSPPFHHHPPQPNTPIDSSMAITVLILLAILFLMAFFSLYLRHFVENHRSSNNHHPSSTTTNDEPILLRHQQLPPSNHVMDPTIVLSLPLISYRGKYNATYHQTECAVCLSEFKERETVKVIPYCRHVFHPRCIDRWLYGHASCPVCRASTAQMLQEGKECGSTVGDGDTCTVERGERETVRITRCNSSSSSSSSSDGSLSSLECLGETRAVNESSRVDTVQNSNSTRLKNSKLELDSNSIEL